MSNLISWGRIKESQPKSILHLQSRNQSLISVEQMLAIGNLRSYGDEAYNDEGLILLNTDLNRFINFDRNSGYLTAECGVTLASILSLIVPCGWFLIITPGTKYITLGGAIANDVHGKNHHGSGSFGLCVEEFELCRSSGERLICSRSQNSGYFFATLGGMGLTGWIVWAKIKLLPIQNPGMLVNSYKFANLSEYFKLNSILEAKSTYSVAWIDCLASAKNLGRGIYFTGEHAGYQERIVQSKSKSINFIFTPKSSLINSYSLRLFNFLYYNRRMPDYPMVQHYEPFFYPLDSIKNWNRVYGSKGFYQYQFVVSHANAEDAITEALRVISKQGVGSFLAVLKTFGNIESGGLLSFARPGVALALDFANQGEKTMALFRMLNQIVLDASGAIYPAKDACMSSELFVSGYPNLDKFRQYKDPQFSSNFWTRVGE